MGDAMGEDIYVIYQPGLLYGHAYYFVKHPTKNILIRYDFEPAIAGWERYVYGGATYLDKNKTVPGKLIRVEYNIPKNKKVDEYLKELIEK